MRTLQNILRIAVELLAADERQGMELAEDIYKALGSPVSPPELRQAIEEIQARCRRRGVRYPRVLLRRKIELGAGEYVPQRPQPEPDNQARPIAIVRLVCCMHCRAEFDRSWLRDHYDCAAQPRKAAPTPEEKTKEA